MMQAKSLGGVGVASVLVLAASAAFGVGDCCTNKQTERSFRNETVHGWTCSSVWSSTHRDFGKFCFPLGSGYGPNITYTLTVGQQFDLNASFTIGDGGAGVTVGAAKSYSVSAAYSHTAPAGQNCQLYLSYDNAVLRRWKVQRFCVIGDRTFYHSIFTSFGTTTVTPCCEPAGGGGGGGGLGVPPPDLTGDALPEREPRGESADGSFPDSTLIVDLREQVIWEPHDLPSWHPMNNPGSSLSTLNGWQRREIMRQVREAEIFQGYPVNELAVIDVDGTVQIWDLESAPWGLVPCAADLNSDWLVDQSDVVMFVNYFLSEDPAADVDGSGLLDLADLTTFAQSALTGCP